MEWTPHWSPRASSDTISCTFSYHCHMAFHHLHHLHYHCLHLLLLAQCFIPNSRPGSSANPFLLRPFSLLLDWLHELSDHLTILLCSTVVMYWCVRLSRLLAFECTLNHCTFIHSSAGTRCTVTSDMRHLRKTLGASQLVTRSTRHSQKSYDELTGGWNTVMWRVDRWLKRRAVTAVTS